MSKTEVRSSVTKAEKSNGKVKAPVEESGRDAFMRIAEGRMNRLLGSLNTLAKMASGKSKYGYTDEDVEHIRDTLTKSVNAACDRLRKKAMRENFSFERDARNAGS